ncbi:isochorismatase family protein [Martelella alba]|uniref:Isochorismatase family protein n=1 Tax=Martelella alba TaxID=2590451 RepID=A0A506U4Y8_9HYPH|nr:isochorismatase family protein [Martelella alba]TPW26977.1 isochorismatase family protein [Martelella alba]
MPLTTLDKAPALIIVDLQKGLAGLSTAHPFDDVVANSRRLAEAFRQKRLPVVLVNVAGGAPGRADIHQNRPADAPAARPVDWAELLEELGQQPDDILVTKNTWGAFHGTGLAETLTARHVSQVVITGVATSIGVESTARSAHEHGFHVVLATDAMTDIDLAAHGHSTSRIFPRLGETATTDEILAKLDARS